MERRPVVTRQLAYRLAGGVGVVVMAAFAAAYAPLPRDAAAHSAGVVAHEWGTFTTVAGLDGRATDWFPLGGPSDLPCFVERFRIDSPSAESGPTASVPPTRVPVAGKVAFAVARIDSASGRPVPVVVNAAPLPGRAGYDYAATRANVRATVRMETPVVYFYSSVPATVDVRVDFPRGLMTEWFPHAQVQQGDVSTATLNDAGKTATIEWRNVNIIPGLPEGFPTEPGASHYYAARATDATPVTVGPYPEKFLFYRGVATFDVPLATTLQPDGQVRVDNLGEEPLPGVILFEKRDGRIGFRFHGSVRTSAVIAPPELDGDFASLRRTLETTLVDAGLYPKEAAAMVDTWRDSWFEEGLRVFYLFPSRTIDAVLPLRILPTPTRTVRVFVGRMELITPALEEAIDRAVRTNNVGALEPRARFFGPVADRILRRDEDVNKSIRYRDMANLLLDSYVRKMSVCP
jgi:hypothetical protein